MGKPTTIDEIATALSTFGECATLITVTGDGRPHVTTSMIRTDDGQLLGSVGSRTRKLLEQRPGITLLWHPPAGLDYQLIVDATVTRLGPPDPTGVSTIHMNIDSGIQHRLAGLPEPAQSCRAVDAG